MAWFGVRALLLWTAASALAWGQVAEISGTFSDANGPVARMVVRARAVDSGKVFEGSTNAKGTYSLRLPAGAYDLFATVVARSAFAQRGIVLKAGEHRVVDAVLSISGNEGTPGELTFQHLADERVAPAGPAPKLGKVPDLRGVWYASPDLEPEAIPFQPWAAEFARTHTPGSDPRARCLPSGVARANQNELAKIVQTPELIVILYEGSPPGVRQIFLDGRGHPEPGTFLPTWMGDSIGRWEGQTLVVDTTGFNDRGWVDYRMTPQTEQLHVIERYTRTDLGHLDLEITVDDPGAYTRPWKIHRRLVLAPKGEEIQEYICNENNSAEHLSQ